MISTVLVNWVFRTITDVNEPLSVPAPSLFRKFWAEICFLGGRRLASWTSPEDNMKGPVAEGSRALPIFYM